jgi:multidrug resistance efflux pump
MATLWTIIVNLGGGLLKVVIKVLELMRDKQLVEQGKALARAEQDKKELAQAKIEVEVAHEQTEILMKQESKNDIVEKLNNGKF